MLERLFERRALSFQSIWASGGDLELGTLSRTVVNSDTAFQVNAVFSAVSLISDTIATLPIDVYIRRDGARYPFRPRPAWVAQPDVDLPGHSHFYQQVIVSMLLSGAAYIRVYSSSTGEVVNLNVLNPVDVTIKRNGLGRVMFQVVGEDKPLSSEEVIFIPDLLKPGGDLKGVSRIESLKNNFGLAIALENYASNFFGNGTNVTGVLEVPGNLTADQAKNLQEAFDSRHRGWRNFRTAVLSGGAKFVSTSTDPERSSLIEARNQAVADIARAFNIPGHLLGLQINTSYSSLEEQNLAFLTHTLRPIIQKLEAALSPLMSRYQGGADAFVKFNIENLLRANINDRMSAYSIGLQAGFFSINEIRRFEDLVPIADPSADTVRVPLANVNVDASTLSAEEKKVGMAQKLVVSGYDPTEVLAALGLPAIAHSGLPSTQLQAVAQIDPENPQSVY
jgi:HK97 family phage portal protein